MFKDYVSLSLVLITLWVFSHCAQPVRQGIPASVDSSGTWVIIEDSNGALNTIGTVTISQDSPIRRIGFDEKTLDKFLSSTSMYDCKGGTFSVPPMFVTAGEQKDIIFCQDKNKTWEQVPLADLSITPHQRTDSYNFCIGQSCGWAVKSQAMVDLIKAELRDRYLAQKQSLEGKRTNIEKKLGKIRRDGKFGGGYKEAKWGQTPEETAQLFSPLTVDPKQSNRFVHESEKIKVFFTYYLGVLAEVEVRLKLDGYDFTDSRDAREALIKKYGKPVIKQIRKGVDTLERVPYAFTVKLLSWHDGVSSIETTQCEIVRGDSNGCLKEAEGLSIIYKSIKLAPLLTKLRKENDDASNKYKSAF